MLTQPPAQVGSPLVFTDTAQHHDGIGDFTVTAHNFTPEEDVTYFLVRSFEGADFQLGQISPGSSIGVTNVEVDSKWRIDASAEIQVTRTEEVTVQGESTT